MNCQQIKEYLPLYLEGLTEEEETRMIEEHLDQCSSCHKEMKEMEALQQKLMSLPSVAMPEEAKARVSEAIKEEGKRIRERRKKSRILRFSSLAAVLMLGLFSLVIGSQMGDFFYQPEKAAETDGVMMKKAAPESEGEAPAAEPSPLDPAAQTLQDLGAGGEGNMDPPAPEVRMTAIPEQDEPAPEEAMMMALPPQQVDLYLDLLAEELAGQEYEVLNWEETEPEVFLIHIELTEIDESGESGRIPVSYQGQEGKLCRIE